MWISIHAGFLLDDFFGHPADVFVYITSPTLLHGAVVCLHSRKERHLEHFGAAAGCICYVDPGFIALIYFIIYCLSQLSEL